MAKEIIFYDLPNKGRNACWSPNVWKARLVLNYKNLPYRTEWIEYPDLRPKFQSLGIPPNTSEVNPNAEYSSPAARLPDGRYIMDSLAIASEIEKMQPEPSLGLDTDFPKRTQAALAAIQKPLAPILIPRVPEIVLNPASQEYFYDTRKKRFGMSLPELAKSEQAGETAWKGAHDGMEQVKKLLKENAEGPYIMGIEPTFADFILAGFWQFAKKLDKDGDVFDRMMKFDSSFAEHYEACKQWLEKDD